MTDLIRTLTLGTALAVGLLAQSDAPAQPDRSAPANAPYRGQTGLPNNAAANDQPNTALSGNTPQTNSSMQKTRDGNLGIEFGYLGLLGLFGLLGLGIRNGTNEPHDVRTPEMHRG